MTSAWRRLSVAGVRSPAARRGGAFGTTAGVVLVAASYAAMLAAGPRLLGTHQFGGLAIAWTVAAIFGFGLATPTEQLITRRLNVRTPDAVRPALTALGAAAVLASGGCIAVAAASTLDRGFHSFGVTTVLAVASWVALVFARARLAGAGDLRRYTEVLVVEAAARAVLVVIAIADRSASDWLLGLAIGLPLALAALVGMLTPVASTRSAVRVPIRFVTGDQVAFLLVSLGFQACLNGPALIVGWRAHSQSFVGPFVAASTYFRAPTILMGGIVTHALVALSHAWASKDHDSFRAVTRRSMVTATALTVALIAVLGALAPVVLPAYYGHDLHLPDRVLAGLAISSVLTVVGGVAVQPLLAAGRNAVAGLSWGLGALVTLVVVSASDGVDTTTAVGLVAGPLVAAALVVVADLTAFPPGRRVS